jgi:hypothetical protein
LLKKKEAIVGTIDLNQVGNSTLNPVFLRDYHKKSQKRDKNLLSKNTD